MKVSAQYAEEHFADLLNAASNGEEVEIALPGKPSILLTRVLALANQLS
jgi:antitoxin (DNA-binding transcriptional repressor) of toxin-antitoxin stability system